MRHFRRLHYCIKFLAGEEAEVDRGLAEGAAAFVRGLGDLGGVVVADLLVERGDEHQRVVEEVGDAVEVRLDADNAVVDHGDARIGQQPDGVEIVEDHHRLVDV